MKWTIEYFEQVDTTQLAEVFEDALVVTHPKLRKKIINRYEQRRRKLLQNEEVAAGYREMAAELELMRAIDKVRKQLDMSQEQLAARMGKKREAVSRLLSAEHPHRAPFRTKFDCGYHASSSSGREKDLLR